MGYIYSLLLLGAGIYAILLGNNWIPKSGGNTHEEDKDGKNKHHIQYTLAGLILIYFGASNLYAVVML